jgi:serine protease
MKKYFIVITILIGFSVVWAAGLNNQAIHKAGDKPDLVADEVIVAFLPNTDETLKKNIVKKYELTLKKNSKKAGKFSVYKHKNPQNILKKLAKENGVLFAEQNAYAYASWVPNDPYYSPYQWHMPRIGMEDAWPLSTGTGVIVAINDTGVKQSLEDLAQTNFMAGYDFINNDNDPTDDEGHGSHVCGTVAQSTNNAVGVTGIAYGCTIMPVKVLNAQGSGSYDQIADGIYYATDNGAHIINMSLSGTADLSVLRNAVNYAWNNGVLVVCAAGNDTTSSPRYPAAYANSMSVSATNYLDQLSNYSNYGSTIDICAPGGDGNDYNGDGYIDGVLQNTFDASGDGYFFYYGTSMASPHVAGVAALVKSADMTLTNSGIRTILETTTIDLGSPGWDQYFGNGMVDAYAAVNEALGGSPPDTTPPVISNIQMVDITHNSARVTWTTDEPADSTVYYGTTTSYGSSESNSAYVTSHSVTLSNLIPDTLYHFKVSSTDPSSNNAESGDNTFTTNPQPTEVFIFVNNINMEVRTYFWILKYCRATINIKDTDGVVVPSATVYVQWSGSVSGTDSGVTDSNGNVVFDSAITWGTGTYTITVTNVTHATKTYDPSLNVETSDTI